ncbi:MAG TPA: helix-turn-helix transcriptional regulator [Candidatus Staskawiczbacteria bacterium]|nr:helix-turn-helix transcriptional regulator [Candidatus Staskawiczbacteria bacterium]
MRYSNRLRHYRKLNHLKQRHVAHLLGIKNHSLVSRWENGSSLPDLQNALKLSKIYSVQLDELFVDLKKSLSLNQANDEIVDLMFELD